MPLSTIYLVVSTRTKTPRRFTPSRNFSFVSASFAWSSTGSIPAAGICNSTAPHAAPGGPGYTASTGLVPFLFISIQPSPQPARRPLPASYQRGILSIGCICNEVRRLPGREATHRRGHHRHHRKIRTWASSSHRGDRCLETLHPLHKQLEGKRLERLAPDTRQRVSAITKHAARFAAISHGRPMDYAGRGTDLPSGLLTARSAIQAGCADTDRVPFAARQPVTT